jgi:drug/metabolite transporter (DMT)-like permease
MAFVPVFNKLAMEEAGDADGPMWYALIISAVMIPVMILRLTLEPLHRNDGSFFSPVIMRGGLIIAVLWVFYMIAKGHAMDATPHPSYVEALDRLSPLWVTAITCLAYGRRESGRVLWAGVVMVACVAGLILLAV